VTGAARLPRGKDATRPVKSGSPLRCVRWQSAAALVAALLLLSALPLSARTARSRKAVAGAQYERAEKLRAALNGRPESQRTRNDYLRVIDAYQKVYLRAPSFARASTSVTAVAELWAEAGRRFHSDRDTRRAIQQYEFLRQQYPGSPARFEALFTIAELYLNDLDDAAKAKATFQEFLKRYPHHRLAEQARQEIAAIDHPRPARKERVEAKVEETVPGTPAAKASPEAPVLVTGIRHWATPDYTRVVVDLEGEVKYEAGRIPDPDRIFFDLHDTRLASELIGKSFDVEDGFLKRIRVAPFQKGLTRVVLEVQDVSDYSAFLLPNPYRLVIDIHGRGPSAAALKALEPRRAEAPPTEKKMAAAPPAAAPKAAAPAPRKEAAGAGTEERDDSAAIAGAVKSTPKPTSEPTYAAVAPRDNIPPDFGRGREAKPTADGDRSLIRALGLKIGRIVVDAGHGGQDTGTIGPTGYEEKDLVLDVALRLGKLLETKLGADVVYTRDDDTFVPLETRTAIANQAQADLFISIHANSSRDRAARGVETYYLNFTSSPDALEVAARENAVSDKSIHELQDLVKKIALKEKIEESREFAADVDKSLAGTLRQKAPAIRDRGVKKAPFIVLIGANMPSILCEISFLSNPTDERNLMRPAYRQKIAEGLYKGVVKYVDGLSGVRVAHKLASKSAPAADER
jgi:N-acetylmuramoyl-L-alanine amidase